MNPRLRHLAGSLLVCASALLFFVTQGSISQTKKEVEEKVKEKTKERTEQKVEEGVEKGLNAVEEGIGNLFKKKEKKEGDNQAKKKPQKKDKTDPEGEESEETDTAARQESGSASQSLQSFSKFDFVPGESVVFFDDFSQDNVGDFPALWNTTSKGEVVTVSNNPGKWFKLGMGGVIAPEFKGKLPENFTLQYDLIFEIMQSNWAGTVKMDFFKNAENPIEASETVGGFGFKVSCGTQEINYNSWGDAPTEGRVDNTFFEKNGSKKASVSVWVQKTRFRMYLNEVKVLDLPRIIPANTTLQGMRFDEMGVDGESNAVYISNFRIAVGAPDMRSKLITEGKLVTRGITFNSGSDKIKPESYGVLKEIATVLKENPTVKVNIVGHTDSDGDDAMNLDLSKRRSAAVKASLSKDFSIDAARMQTDGKGASQPAEPNSTPQGKANNRRVEFIKL